LLKKKLKQKITSLICYYWQIMEPYFHSLCFLEYVSFIYIHTTKNLQVQCQEWKINPITLSHCQKLPTTKNMWRVYISWADSKAGIASVPQNHFHLLLSLASLKNGFNYKMLSFLWPSVALHIHVNIWFWTIAYVTW
jgi:hypothetical protein